MTLVLGDLHMKSAAKYFILALSAIRLIPHVYVMRFSPNRDLVWADLSRWGQIRRVGQPRNCLEQVALFVELMTLAPEYRTLFYYRTGFTGRLLAILCRPMATLELAANRIGPGLFIQHGYATTVSAEEIGENCWINQQVVIGYTNVTDRPTIGNNVKIHAGAKVLGKVTVGDNSTVGANSVVIQDVPPNVTILGVPAKVVRIDKARETHEKS